MGITYLSRQVDYIVEALTTAFEFLHRRKIITDEELYRVREQYVARGSGESRSLIQHLARNANPITAEEAALLESLVDKAEQGKRFTRKETRKYVSIIRRVQEERPGDPRIWPLVWLGSAMSGAHLRNLDDDDE